MHVKKTDYTNVQINFEFNLSGLKVRKTFHDTQRIDQTIIPSYEMITRLVYAMSDRDIYIQRVIENPPHTNRANAEIMNRFWVVTGRRYEDTLPIDFRIVVSGQEYYKDTDIPYSGQAHFEIMTQGTTVNTNARNEIKQLLDEICNTIQCIPKIDIWLIHNQLNVDTWGAIFGYIENQGDILVTNIHIFANTSLIDTESAVSIGELQPNSKKRFQLNLKANIAGEVPLTIMAKCDDHYGQLPPYPHRCKLEVIRQPNN